MPNYESDILLLESIHPGADEMRDAAMVSDVHSMLQMLEVSQVEQEDGDQMRDSGG